MIDSDLDGSRPYRLANGWTLLVDLAQRRPQITRRRVARLVIVTDAEGGRLIEVEVPPGHEALADVIFRGMGDGRRGA